MMKLPLFSDFATIKKPVVVCDMLHRKMTNFRTAILELQLDHQEL